MIFTNKKKQITKKIDLTNS